MIVTWRRYIARRKISLADLVKSYGFNYERLVSYFSARGAVPPGRDEPEIVALFGDPPPSNQQQTAVLSEPVVSQPLISPEKPKRLDVSIKNTKKELLEIAEKLKMSVVTDKMTKMQILAELEKSEKINVVEIKTDKKLSTGDKLTDGST